jgi:hypothetical protein
MQIIFSLNLETGEADITQLSEAKLIDLMYDNPLLAADCLQDICFISSRLYRQSSDICFGEKKAGLDTDA